MAVVDGPDASIHADDNEDDAAAIASTTAADDDDADAVADESVVRCRLERF